MSVEEKIEFFELLVRIGFKEIEVGFPVGLADRVRLHPPPDRGEPHPRRRRDPGPLPVPRGPDHPLARVGRGARRTSSSTSTTPPRRASANMSSTCRSRRSSRSPSGAVEQLKRESRALSGRRHRGCAWSIRRKASPAPSSISRSRSARRSRDAWGPTPADKIILNLPATVEYATPERPRRPDRVDVHAPDAAATSTIVSLHTHNDRGTGIAATELALLAGADRVEGTLFGNGERTGNLDIVTVALNLYTQGIDPGLDFGDLNAIRDVYERCTRLEVPRAPALRRRAGLHRLQRLAPGRDQEVAGPAEARPALGRPLHPDRPGRHRAQLPGDHPDQLAVRQGRRRLRPGAGVRLPAAQAHAQGDRAGRQRPRRRQGHRAHLRRHPRRLPARNTSAGTRRWRSSTSRRPSATRPSSARPGSSSTAPPTRWPAAGNGPIDAFVRALGSTALPKFDVVSYSEHSLGAGAEAKAVSYIQIKIERGAAFFGAGIDTNIELASIKAIVSALNRAMRPAMKFEPAKRPLTGETLESLTAALAERGERPFRAHQILDWVYKKRARSWDDDDQPAQGAARLARRGRSPSCRPSLVLNRHSADVTDKLLLELEDRSLIETVIIRAPQDGVGPRPFAQDDLHLDPGRLRHGLRLLRERAGRPQARPERRRDRRPAPAGLLRRGRADAARPRRAGLVRQHRRHGHGRAARQLRRPHPGAHDRQRRRGAWASAPAGSRSRPAASCRRSSGWPTSRSASASRSRSTGRPTRCGRRSCRSTRPIPWRSCCRP